MKKMVMICSLGLLGLPMANLAQAQDELSIKADAGLGYSSNAYHAPSATYFDYVAGAQVTPNVQSGFFAPLAIDVKYHGSSDILAEYKFKGRYYTDSALSNANVYDSKIKLGLDKPVESGQLYAGIFLGWHTQTYFDKDSGLNKISNVSGADISPRYNYQDFGLQAKYEVELSGVSYAVEGQYRSLNYDTVVVSELDNTQLHLGGYAKLNMTDVLRLKLGYKFYSQDYSQRQARDLSAALVATTRSYTHHAFDGQLRWQPDEKMKVFLDAGYAKRVDNFVGYNDYTKTLLKVRGLYTLNQELSLRGKILYSNTDYANAFIFEDPTLAKKTSSTTLLSISGKYKTPLLLADTLWAKMDYKSVVSNDLRYDYKLTEISVGGDWSF